MVSEIFKDGPKDGQTDGQGRLLRTLSIEPGVQNSMNQTSKKVLQLKLVNVSNSVLLTLSLESLRSTLKKIELERKSFLVKTFTYFPLKNAM